MKSKSWMRALAAVLVAAAIAAGCSLFPVSIPDRLDLFAQDLSSMDRGSVYLNFHPTLTTDYDAIKDPSFWDAKFADGTYTIYNVDASDPAAVTALIDGPAVFGNGKAAVFKMAQNGQDWMIEEITSISGVAGSPVVD